MPATAAPLLAALNSDEALATAAWRTWRNSVDVQHLTWPEMQLLPIFNGPRLDAWLIDDSAAGIMKGIVRRAWSEAQVRLNIAREVAASMSRSGCAPVTLIGAVGAYLRGLDSAAIRPILELRILIPRWHLPLADAILEAEGWQMRDAYPAGDQLEGRSHILYDRNGSRLYLHWRVLEVEPRLAANCEREFLARHTIAPAIGADFRILTPDRALLEALSGHSESVDVLPWQAEAALVLHPSANGGIDWHHFYRMAARFAPDALDRVADLRSLGLQIPPIGAMKPRTGMTHRIVSLLAGITGRS